LKVDYYFWLRKKVFSMSEQPGVKTASNVLSNKQDQQKIGNPRDDEVYADEDPFEDLGVDSDHHQFKFSSHFNDEGNSFSETDEAKTSVKKPSVPIPTKINAESKLSTIKSNLEEDEKLETSKCTDLSQPDLSLSPDNLPAINSPNKRLSIPPLEVDNAKEITQTPPATAMDAKPNLTMESPYDSVGMEDNNNARSSYELHSHGSRTTMIIHFSPDESDESASALDFTEEVRNLEISNTCSSTCFAPEVSERKSNFTRNQASNLGKEVDLEDERITEIFAWLRSMLQSNSNPEFLQNLTSLEQAFAKKGESKQALCDERDDLVAMHLNFVSRVAEEMSNMKMNPRRWVSLS
jgi:hypothetical protein